jgi:hypothetical protein
MLAFTIKNILTRKKKWKPPSKNKKRRKKTHKPKPEPLGTGRHHATTLALPSSNAFNFIFLRFENPNMFIII